jgi:hypothetical protein
VTAPVEKLTCSEHSQATSPATSCGPAEPLHRRKGLPPVWTLVRRIAGRRIWRDRRYLCRVPDCQQ